MSPFLCILSQIQVLMFFARLTSFYLLSFQEICTLTIATEFGGDKLNTLNFIGLVICMSGIGLHVYIKALKGKKYSINICIIL